MASYKAWYFLALGIVVIGLSNSSMRGVNWFDNLADRASAVAQRTSAHAAQQLAVAEMTVIGCTHRPAAPVMTQHSDFSSVPDFVRVQVAMARQHTEMSRVQAQFARIQAERARAVALGELR